MPTSGSLTSGFGQRWGALHGGADIANAIGTPILAASEGMVIAAHAVGASEGFIYIRSEYPAAVETMRAAILAAERDGGAALPAEMRELLASTSVGAVSHTVVTWASAGFRPERAVVTEALAGFLAGAASTLVTDQ